MDLGNQLRAVGEVSAGGHGEPHAWQALNPPDWAPLDRGRQLYVLADPSSTPVLTGTTEVEVIVAGAISDRPDGEGAAPAMP